MSDDGLVYAWDSTTDRYSSIADDECFEDDDVAAWGDDYASSDDEDGTGVRPHRWRRPPPPQADSDDGW